MTIKKGGIMEWKAICLECSKELESCPNGEFATSAARIHRRETGHKKIIIGYIHEEGEE